MPQEILKVVKLVHNATGEKWLFLYDSTPDVLKAIFNEALDPTSSITFQDANHLIGVIEELESKCALDQEFEDDQEFM